MKNIIIVIIAITASGCSTLRDTHPLEYTWQAVHVIDVLQTANGIAGDPECHSEANPITRRMIGRHPDKDHVYKWGIGTAIFHFFVARWIENRKWIKPGSKTGMRIIDNGIQLQTVVQNHKNGVRIDGHNEPYDGCDSSHNDTNSMSIDLYRW